MYLIHDVCFWCHIYGDEIHPQTHTRTNTCALFSHKQHTIQTTDILKDFQNTLRPTLSKETSRKDALSSPDLPRLKKKTHTSKLHFSCSLLPNNIYMYILIAPCFNILAHNSQTGNETPPLCISDCKYKSLAPPCCRTNRKQPIAQLTPKTEPCTKPCGDVPNLRKLMISRCSRVSVRFPKL